MQKEPFALRVPQDQPNDKVFPVNNNCMQLAVDLLLLRAACAEAWL